MCTARMSERSRDGVANAFRVFNFSEADIAVMTERLVGTAERGRKLGMLEYKTACEQREWLGARMRKLHERYDLIVTPALCWAITA